MVVFLLTDMEGVSGIDEYDQCYDIKSARYQYGCEQLTGDVNAAVAGAFDAGATEVRVLDGHGPNGNKGFLEDKIDKRIKRTWIESRNPIRWEGIGDGVDAVAMVGQHAMAGTLNGFLDHTQAPRTICRFTLNGQEHGEMSQLAMYAGAWNIPLICVSGDEALCEEARRLFPQALSTPTKRGTGWLTCELYDTKQVRDRIRKDIAQSLKQLDRMKPWRLGSPIEAGLEFGCSADADYYSSVPGVQRTHARSVRWWFEDPKDVYTFPNDKWHPLQRAPKA